MVQKLYGEKKLDWLLKLHTKIIYYTNFKQDILIMKPLYQFSRNTEKKIWCVKGEGYKFTWNTSPIYLAWFVKKRSKSSVSHSVISNSCNPMNLPCSSVHGILQARKLEWVAIPFSRGIFPTQGSNPGLLHCRQDIYHPIYQGSPCKEGCSKRDLQSVTQSILKVVCQSARQPHVAERIVNKNQGPWV